MTTINPGRAPYPVVGRRRQFGFTPAQRYAIAVLHASVGLTDEGVPVGVPARRLSTRLNCSADLGYGIAGGARRHLHARRATPDRWRHIATEARLFELAWHGRLRDVATTVDCPASLLRDLTHPADVLRGDHPVDPATPGQSARPARARLRDWLVDALVQAWLAGNPVDRLARQIGVPANGLWIVLEPLVLDAVTADSAASA